MRSYLTDLIREIWLSKTVPTEWKKACTILIHKKGNTNDPSNFRPITLQSIPLKVFTSCLRNAMYSFLVSNNLIEQSIQKGFTPNLCGTLEHTAQMANVINKSRIRQRSVIITLLDLKNAFGEVHHNLIQSVLDYHHIPDHVIITLIQWSDMIIRVDKCSTFGIKKAISKSVQYLPKLLINNRLIPTVKIGESFEYLGRYFDFNMSNDKHKAELTTLVNELLILIQSLYIQKDKLLLYNRYVLSKLSWHFTVATLPKTWIIKNIDSVANQFIRRWLEIPVSGILSTVFQTRDKFGQNIYPPSVKFTQCQTVLRTALKSSPNESINKLWKSTNNHTNIQYDV